MVAGYSYQDWDTYSPNNPTLNEAQDSVIAPEAAFPFYTRNVLMSYYGRAIYNYAGKYVVNVSVRRDGSSRFSPETRWGVFPAASAAWLISEEDFLKQNLLKYNVNYIKSELDIDNNISEVKHIATGFMMIQRITIQKMMIQYHDTKYIDDVSFLSNPENKYAYALFDCRVEDNHYLSEDWLFCNRWTKIGGKIYMDVSIDLAHTGQEDYKGSYISTIL